MSDIQKEVPLIESEVSPIQVLSAEEYSLIEKAREPQQYFEVDFEKEAKEVEEYFSKLPQTFGSSTGGSGKIRIKLDGARITGNRLMTFDCSFWGVGLTSGNPDGNWIKFVESWEGGSKTVTLVSKLVYGTQYTSTSPYRLRDQSWTMPDGKSWANTLAETGDNGGWSSLYAKTGNVVAYQGSFSAAIQTVSSTGVTLRYTYRAYQGEDMCVGYSGGTWQVFRPAETGSSTTTVDNTYSLGVNTARTLSYGQVKDGGSSSDPWVWGSKTINVATNYTAIPMPTVTAYRDSNDPSKVTVKWTAGGTTNKPQGNASRRSVVILRDSNNANVQIQYDVNLESAGSHTFTGCPLDKGFNAFVEYSVTGLNGGTQYPASNRVWIDTAFSARIKVGGSYKTSTEAWVKIGGSYRRITESWVKVGGTYRRIT